MALNDINISKVGGGLGRTAPVRDMVSALLANGVAVVGGVQLNTAYRLNSLDDALSLGIDAEYDTTNTLLLFEHIREFFRVNPSGELWLMLVAQATSYVNMLDITQDNSAKTLLSEAEGVVRQIGVAYNPTVAVTDFTATDAAIAKAQELAVFEYAAHRPVEIFLEGKGFQLNSIPNLRIKNAENVSVMIGQSKSVATEHPTYAAIGTLLGAVSKSKVNESISWVEKFNMLGGSLEVPSVNNTNISTVSSGDIATMNDNALIFFRKYIGFPGVYFNDSFTSTDEQSDFKYIENNRTIHKAVRNIRQRMLPSLSKPVVIDTENGTISPEVIGQFEAKGIKALEQMSSDEEVSDFGIFIDPFQNILASSELKVKYELTPTGTARKIVGEIGFNNPF